MDEPLLIRSTPGGRGHSSTFTPTRYGPLLLVLVIALAGLAALSALRTHGDYSLANGPLDLALTVATLLVALGAAYFAFAEFVVHSRVSGLLLGLGFALSAAAYLGMGIIPMLAGHVPSRLVPFGWATQLALVSILFALAGLFVERTVRVSARVRVITIGLLGTFAFSVLTFFLVKVGAGAPGVSLLRVLEVVTGMLFVVGAVQFYRAASSVHPIWYGWLTLCLLIGGFAQVEFAIIPFRTGRVAPGDVLELISYLGILTGLVAEWSAQYRRLHLQTEELEALATLVRTAAARDTAGVCRQVAEVVGSALEGQVQVQLGGWSSPREPRTAAAVVLKRLAEPGAQEPVIERDDTGAVALGVSLRSGERRLGAMVLARGAKTFSREDIRLLRAFAGQAALLVERSLLYEEVAAGAVLAERSRLAREIHDGLAQHLAFLKMRVAWLRRRESMIPSQSLADIEGVLETALVEARHAITTLRSRQDGGSLAQAIQGYVEEFAQVSGMQVATDIATTADIGPRQRVEILRIVQEALNNVRKHAGTAHIDVTLQVDDSWLEVVVRDNGAGFDLDQGADGHYGLDIMRERAESIGGRLEVISRRGTGTVVSTRVPLQADRLPAPGQG